MNTQKQSPQTASPQASIYSAKDFPFQFPQKDRPLGGAYSTKEAAVHLFDFFHFHTESIRCLARQIIQIPEFELKVELGYHIWYHAEAAQALRNRLQELPVSAERVDNGQVSWIRAFFEEVAYARNSSEFLTGCYEVAGVKIYSAMTEYLSNTDQLADLPSIRILKRIMGDLREMLDWSNQVQEAFAKGGLTFNANWQQHLSCTYDAWKMGQSPVSPFRQNNTFKSPSTICKRDGRFTTFKHTRDYNEENDSDIFFSDEYDRRKWELIRTQRDEIDAIETFALALFGLWDKPFQFKMDLCRFIWDEARHAEAGQKMMALEGIDPFQVPCGIVGINVRAPLPPLVAFAQISIFGELNIVTWLHEISRKAYARNDRTTGIVFDFIHFDELLHLKKGRKWLAEFVPGGDLKKYEEEIRVLAVNRLVEEGVIGEAYAQTLTAQEIFDLVGGE